MKILVLVVLLCVLNFTKLSASIDLTYIVTQKHGYVEPNCVAENAMTYSAIGWIYPIPENKEDIPKTQTTFLPEITSNYTCSFEKGHACSTIWKTSEWQVKSQFDLLFDTRWEGLPTLLTTKKTGAIRTEIPIHFNVGLSIRTGGNAEIYLCEGWNYTAYPCYYINVGDRQTQSVYLQKYNDHTDFQKGGNKLTIKKYNSSILFEHEWRNFELRLDSNGTITLQQAISKANLLSYTDVAPLKLLYLFVNSEEPALWKIHNNQYLYTTRQGILKFGPPLQLESKDLCISFYVSLCDNCSMLFYLEQNGERQLLKNIVNNGEKWRYVVLNKDYVYEDFVQVYVETKLIGSQETLFWASVDDVRVCYKNEIKISRIVSNETASVAKEDSDDVWCQSILHQQWRPSKHVQQILNVLPGIETDVDSTSITLSLIPYSMIPTLTYLISYQGSDICEKATNKKRTKSRGYIITKEHKAFLTGLVPYTHYEIQLSFVLHENVKNVTVNTFPTDRPTQLELPSNVTVTASDTQAKIYWTKPNCTDILGPLFYALNVSSKLGYSKQFQSIENVYVFEDLQPFTTYDVEVLISRYSETLMDSSLTVKQWYNFTTAPGVAQLVRNLEAYATDLHSISLRYDLPLTPGGMPESIQIKLCIAAFDCETTSHEIRPCKLWPDKYCIYLNKLRPHVTFDVSVSLKNLNTAAYGEKTRIVVKTQDAVPGMPTNVTYEIVNCHNNTDFCHLNVSWRHPYDQKGSITEFNIILNETEPDYLSVSSHIHEVLKVQSNGYLPQYTYQIKYLPYSTSYELAVQSVNEKYKSDFAKINVKTDDLGSYIDQRPRLVDVTNSSFTFALPKLDWRLSAASVTAIVQDYDKQKITNALGMKLEEDDLCNAFGNTWVAAKFELSAETQEFTIGDVGTHDSNNSSYKSLQPQTRYCLTFIIVNKYREKEHRIVYYEKDLYTKPLHKEIHEHNAHVHLYVLAFMLLCVPIGFLVYRYLKKRKQSIVKAGQEENVYETLPFEDCDGQCVYNETYDKLIHE